MANLKKYKFSRHCPRCGLHAQGLHDRAQFFTHTEACRARIYQAMRDAGDETIKHADQASSVCQLDNACYLDAKGGTRDSD